MKILSCPAASEAGCQFPKEATALPGCESAFCRDWDCSRREQMSSKACTDLRELQQGRGFGAVSMHSLQPQLHPELLWPLSPQMCPSFLLLSALRYRTGTGTGQRLPAALCWQLCLPISLSQLLGRLKKVFLTSAGWTGGSLHDIGMSAPKQRGRCTEQPSEAAAHSVAVSKKGTRVFQRENCKLDFLG